MIIYLAGGYSGNLRPIWDKGIKNGTMEIYLAGDHIVKNGKKIQSWQGLNILESYYYLRKNTNFERLLHTIPMNFLLDSGAFSMKANSSIRLDWKKYIYEYTDFINRHKIDKFIELDIEEIVGMKEYEYLRDMLIERTGKLPIVVWHPVRGYDYWKKMLDKFPYVAIATTFVKNEGKVWRKNPSLINRFIYEAHSAGCKIHGLGYTKCTTLRDLHFDSIDSTAWLYGNRAGYIYQFNPMLPNFFKKYVREGRLKPEESAIHNFKEWVKFSLWAKKNL